MAKNKFLAQAREHLVRVYGDVRGDKIADAAQVRFEELCKENSDHPKAMHPHTHAKIFPCISVIDAQIQDGIERAAALEFMFKFIEFRSYRAAKIVQKAMKLPLIHKKMPKLFGNMTKKTFGTRQRFDAVFYEISNSKMHFDMTKCPYYDNCVKYGYPEITTAFCRGDDIIYGNMHPKLVWGRTKTLGDGDDVCNFMLTLKE